MKVVTSDLENKKFKNYNNLNQILILRMMWMVGE